MLQHIAQFATEGLRYSADLILPPVCVFCSTLITRHNLLCPRCWSGLNLITPPLCDRLGVPLPGYEGSEKQISMQAHANPPLFSRARAAAHYGGIVRKLIVRFKFEDKHEPLPLFIKLMQAAGQPLLDDADLLVPAPLHRLRLLQRRFNQSALLAKGLACVSGVPACVTSLERVRRTRPQVGLQEDARRQNVADAFKVSPGGYKRLRGKRVLLIDDVITTGSTANACAAALLDAGARSVDVLAVALVAHGFEAEANQELY